MKNIFRSALLMSVSMQAFAVYSLYYFEEEDKKIRDARVQTELMSSSFSRGDMDR